MAGEGFRIAKIVTDVNNAQGIQKAKRLVLSALNGERQHGAAARHLRHMHSVVWVIGATGITHGPDFGMLRNGVGEARGAVTGRVHTQRQGFKPFQHHPGIERRWCRPGMAQIGIIDFGHKVTIAEDGTGHDPALTIHMLGCRIDDNVCAEVEWFLKHRRGEDIVDNEFRPGLSAKRGHGGDIDPVEEGIGRAFDQNKLGGFRKGPRPGVHIGAVDEFRFDTVFGQEIGDDPAAGAEEGRSGDNAVALLDGGGQGGRDGTHARRCRPARLCTLDQGQSLLQHLDGGAAIARIDETILVAAHSRRSLFGAIICIARCEIKRLGNLAMTRPGEAAANRSGCGFPSLLGIVSRRICHNCPFQKEAPVLGVRRQKGQEMAGKADQLPGVLPDHEIHALAEAGAIRFHDPLDADQVQPASLDLRLAEDAYRVRASFLPGRDRTVAQVLQEPGMQMHRVDLSGDGAVLETGCVYLVPLQEGLKLPAGLSARANPKSSTGRIDVFTRVVTNRGKAFDDVSTGYSGPLYLEISPRTFSILARRGDRLAQLRLRRGGLSVVSEKTVSVDLSTSREAPVGWRAKRHSGMIDLRKIGRHDIAEFWEPVTPHRGRIVLNPDEFYILASREKVKVSSTQAAEMAPIAPELGEFRAHYAGFFDPGFGTNKAGSRAVLEVRSRDVPFILEDGQPVAKLVYETLSSKPEALYGRTGSHYQGQGLKLSKHFETEVA